MLHRGFQDINEAIVTVVATLKKKLYNPIKRETKESEKNFNNKCRKAERLNNTVACIFTVRTRTWNNCVLIHRARAHVE